MELKAFLIQIQNQVRAEISDRIGQPGTPYPFHETVFSEIVMQHMAEVGMTFDPEPCHFQAKVGNGTLRLSGFAISDDADQIDLFVSLYSDVEDLVSVPDSETKNAAEQCLRFLAKCADGKLVASIDESNDAYQLALNIQQNYAGLDQIRIYVITDRIAKSKQFQSREVSGKTVKLEVMDIERLHRHLSEGKPRDEVVVNFEEVCGGPIPCIWIPGDNQCDYALTVFPGEALRFVYEKYGARLLEANVRSFLSASGKVNAGIRKTLREQPEQFIAFNNGIVVVADEAMLQRTEEGGNGILWLKGMQIVNGGQTTASIYFTKKKNPDIDLRKVRVPAKLIVFKKMDSVMEEGLVSDISRFANSQNSVKLSDLSANKAYHVELEKLSNSTYCPDGVGRWFYERAAGSYNVLLMREGSTPAKLRQLREAIPPARRVTKTDLAKFLHAWGQLPHLVSLGGQKNFEKFMDAFREQEGGESTPLPDLQAYKRMMAQAILFKKTQSLVRPLVQAFAANVTTYLVSLLSARLGDHFNLDLIWQAQDISPQLRQQIQAWAIEVNGVLHSSSAGRMISEWAKKPECWDAVRDATYSQQTEGIPEVG
jgi:uncharacterized protein Usg